MPSELCLCIFILILYVHHQNMFHASLPSLDLENFRAYLSPELDYFQVFEFQNRRI